MTMKRRISRLPGVLTLHRALFRRHPKPARYHKPILCSSEGGKLIYSLLGEEHPALVARIGSTELECVMHYLGHRRRSRRRCYPTGMRRAMSNNAGFFPAEDGTLDAFAQEYLAAIAQADIMGVWFNIGEDRVVREFCPKAELVRLMSIEPYYSADPWTRGLRGRKVLVVHPFAESIAEQYEKKRKRLFDDPNVLPPFDLCLIKAVQSVAGEVSAFDTWFDALASMKAAMDAIAYDVCLVGAGAYGLPLAAHAKRSGKMAIHMGGATQILFGIKGRRWDDHDVISKLYRDSWTRPKECEVPRNAMMVEDGCYW
jgi:hypothetical protein